MELTLRILTIHLHLLLTIYSKTITQCLTEAVTGVQLQSVKETQAGHGADSQNFYNTLTLTYTYTYTYTYFLQYTLRRLRNA